LEEEHNFLQQTVLIGFESNINHPDGGNQAMDKHNFPIQHVPKYFGCIITDTQQGIDNTNKNDINHG
jgi:hypothetical protein